MEVLELEDQHNGELVEFDLIAEKDLPFLSRQTEMGHRLREAVIDSNMDDDVLTDDELAHGAKRMLGRCLEEAITDFVNNPESARLITNLN